MNTDKFAAIRESPNDHKITMPIAELCSHYTKVYSGAVRLCSASSAFQNQPYTPVIILILRQEPAR
ncbi:MAG: hypothetical protein AAF797_15015 [Planctomycetota bacterium]